MRTLWTFAGICLLAVSITCTACSSSPAFNPRPLGSGSAASDDDAGAKDAGAAKSGGASGISAGVVIPNGAAGGGATTGSDGFCTGLQCQQHTCSSAKVTTTISGKVFDPAGKNPLYNVVVYVPNEAVKPLKTGASCDACDTLYTGKPIATALTDAYGKFVLKNAPDGKNIPLVLQIGKWRRQLKLASVTRCKDNPQADGSLRLPRNHKEGDIPTIAISTGQADTLECLLARVGVDRSEYIPGTGTTGRIHIFHGGGPGVVGPMSGAPNTAPAAPESSDTLWDKKADLMPYDIVLLSCEGGETSNMNQQALHDYASAGGRVFASHFHYAWFNTGPYGSENLATWTPGSNHIDTINATIETKLPNGKPFPKGVALETWLTNVKALTNGELPITEARHNADVGASNTPSQSWIIADQMSPAPGATQYFSFNTPTTAKPRPDGLQYCGRVVFSDLHVGAASGDMKANPVPDECTDADLSPQEDALEFMLFDLSSCVTPDNKPPAPPIPQ